MQIGLLRESTCCACRYIAKRLAKLGMRVVPVKEQVLQPRHLRAEYQKRYLEYEEVRYQVPDDGILERSFLEETIQKYGTFFRLFIDD